MVNSKEALKILTGAFVPYDKSGELVIKSFKKLKTISSLELGDEIEVSGYVTYSSKRPGKDRDVHFNLSPSLSVTTKFVVCEIQNANLANAKQLNKAKEEESLVTVSGVLRMFPEHIYKNPNQPMTPHIFEIHPVRSVIIGEDEQIDSITLDNPDHEDFRAALEDVVHYMDSFERQGDTLKVDYQEPDLIFTKPHQVGYNYIYVQGSFSKTLNGSFPEDKPYQFELKSLDGESVIKAATIPGAPAYEDVRSFHKNPPDGILTVVALRSLNLAELYDSNYEIVLSPVFRIEQTKSKERRRRKRKDA